ncbi:MAG TPA: Fe-S cluster assembly protein SufB, partial [Opitutales bacterium]|nr:Fe-S cluster assembly protein SufB [Opitutales bacterium]
MPQTSELKNINTNIGDFSFPEEHKYDAGTGLSPEVIDYISDVKEEPDWIREFRHKALKTFEEKPLPTHWASKDLEAIDFDALRYYLAGDRKPKRSWDDVPDDV